MTITYQNGLGGTLGDSLVTCKPFISSVGAVYVSSLIGVDAGGSAGLNRDKPLATLSQAYTNSTTDGVIVLLDGHTETLTGAFTIGKRLTIIGEGSNAGIPTVTLYNNQAAGGLLTLSTAGVQLRNIKFPGNVQTCAVARLTLTAANIKLRGCYFECGSKDTGPAVSLGSGASQTGIRNTTFISTATLTTAQPESALKSAAAVTNLYMEGVTFDDGTVGFSNPYAYNEGANVTTGLYAEGLSLLRGSKMIMNVSSTGWVNVQTATGGARVDF